MGIFKKLQTKLRHGLFLQYLKDRLMPLGIYSSLFYWIEEGVNDMTEPEYRLEREHLSFEFFGEEEMQIMGQLPGRGDLATSEKMCQRLKDGNMCFGIKYKGEIVAFNWFDFKDSTFSGYRKKLDPNQVYLFDLYTMREYRGKNLGPLLRYKSYEALNKLGKKGYFSVSEKTNKPAIAFKKKLNAQFISLHLYIELFKKWRFHWLIKKYST